MNARLERVELIRLAVPMKRRFRSSVSAISTCETLLVRVSGEGLEGWGEVVADVRPEYGPETLDTAARTISAFLAPPLLERAIDGVPSATQRWAWVRGHSMAKAGVELALWDWWGRLSGASVASLLGQARARVPVGVSVGLCDSASELEAQLEGFRAEGYRHAKLKVTPAWLEEPIAVARRSADAFAIDANGSFTGAELDRLLALSGPAFVEQPFAWDDLVDHAALTARSAVPVALDESVPSLAALRSAIALGALEILNVKPGRVGGLLAAKACVELAAQAGLGVFIGGMLETAIGRAGNVAVASLDGVNRPSDLPASSRTFETDLATPFVLGPDSTLTVPGGPGLGVTVDEAAIRRFRTS